MKGPVTLTRRPPSRPPLRRPVGRDRIDPRFAERRLAVARRHSRRRRVAVVTVLVVVTLAASAWPLLHSRWFSARAISVVGNHQTTTRSVLQASGLATHPPMIDLDPAAAERAIETLPWVAGARVELHWPDGVVVRITERHAVAAVADGPRAWAEVDGTGRVLAVVPAAPAGLAHLVSVGTPGSPGTTLQRAQASLTVAASLPAAFASMVTAVSPSPGGGVDLTLADGVGVVLGTPTQLPSKYEDVASLLAGATPARGSVIDVSVPDSPVVTPPAA